LRVVIFVPYDESSAAKIAALHQEREASPEKRRLAKKPN
jgi:hypothetical protein